MKCVLSLFLLLCVAQLGAQPYGQWYATLEVGATTLPLVLDLTEDGGTLLSERQSPTPVPLSSMTIGDDSLAFKIATVGLSYTGAVTQDSITGILHQGVFSRSVTFYRTPPVGVDETGSANAIRPQEPTDFPYRRDTVSFPGGDESVVLAGELTRPEGPAHAVVVLISGSGPQDRNEDMGPAYNHRPFLVLSDHLTRRGYAVLRYDDRGTNESTGSFASATSADFAEDAASAVGYLRGQPEFSELPLGLIGHSEGGMIAPVVATASPEVDFLVLLAAPGVSIDSLMLQQRRELSGGSPPDEPLVRAVYGYAKAHPEQDSAAFARGIQETVAEVLPGMPASFRELVGDTVALARAYEKTFLVPWMRYFLSFEPGEYLEEVTVPVLALGGDKDRQVRSSDNLQAIGEALRRAGNGDFTLVTLPGLNHLFQPAETGMPQEYGAIEITLDPSLLERVTVWLDERYR